MANRYWVGGSGTWNTSNTANWSGSSGGSGGASVPTSSDYVFFDGNSGSGTVTLDYLYNYLPCAGISKNNGLLSLTPASNTYGISITAGPNTYASQVLEVYNSLNNNPGASFSISINSLNNGGTYSVRLGGANNGVYLQVARSGSPRPLFTLQDNLYCYGIGIDAVQFFPNGYAMYASYGNLVISGGSSPYDGSYTLGSAYLYASGTVSLNAYGSGTNISHTGTIVANALGVYGSGGGSSYSISSATLTSYMELSGSGANYSGTATISSSNGILYAYQSSPTLGGQVSLTGTSASVQITGSHNGVIIMNGGSINNPNAPSTASIYALQFTNGSGTYTFNSNFNATSFTANGSSRGSLTIRGDSSVRTLTLSSYTLSNITWSYINGAGTIPFTGTGFVDGGNNSNIQFAVPGSSLFFGSNF